jgi:hypothetical protein
MKRMANYWGDLSEFKTELVEYRPPGFFGQITETTYHRAPKRDKMDTQEDETTVESWKLQASSFSEMCDTFHMCLEDDAVNDMIDRKREVLISVLDQDGPVVKMFNIIRENIESMGIVHKVQEENLYNYYTPDIRRSTCHLIPIVSRVLKDNSDVTYVKDKKRLLNFHLEVPTRNDQSKVMLLSMHSYLATFDNHTWAKTNFDKIHLLLSKKPRFYMNELTLCELVFHFCGDVAGLFMGVFMSEIKLDPYSSYISVKNSVLKIISDNIKRTDGLCKQIQVVTSDEQTIVIDEYMLSFCGGFFEGMIRNTMKEKNESKIVIEETELEFITYLIFVLKDSFLAKIYSEIKDYLNPMFYTIILDIARKYIAPEVLETAYYGLYGGHIKTMTSLITPLKVGVITPEIFCSLSIKCANNLFDKFYSTTKYANTNVTWIKELLKIFNGYIAQGNNFTSPTNVFLTLFFILNNSVMRTIMVIINRKYCAKGVTSVDSDVSAFFIEENKIDVSVFLLIVYTYMISVELGIKDSIFPNDVEHITKREVRDIIEVLTKEYLSQTRSDLGWADFIFLKALYGYIIKRKVISSGYIGPSLLESVLGM